MTPAGTNPPFSFFPAFDKEANDKIVSHIFAMSSRGDVGNPLTMLLKAIKTENVKKNG